MLLQLFVDNPLNIYKFTIPENKNTHTEKSVNRISDEWEIKSMPERYCRFPNR